MTSFALGVFARRTVTSLRRGLSTAAGVRAVEAAWHPSDKKSLLGLDEDFPAAAAAALPSAEQAAEISALTARLGLNLDNDSLMADALLPARGADERMSFLGRTVLQSVLSEYAYVKWPQLPAPALRSLQQHLLADARLARAASHVGLQHALPGAVDGGDEESKGWQGEEGAERTTTTVATTTVQKSVNKKQYNKAVANGLRAVVAAALVDGGASIARNVARNVMGPQLATLDVAQFLKLEAHPKATLVALLESSGRDAPVTRIIDESGRNTHMPTFRVGCFSGEALLGEGAGWSIKMAESEAIRDALVGHFAQELPGAPLPWGDGTDDPFPLEDQIQLMEAAAAADVEESPTE